MYTISVDADRRIIFAHISGFLDVGEVEDFGRAEQVAARSLGCGSGEFGLLITTAGGMVQTQQVIDAFRQLIGRFELKAGRIAVVTKGALLTMQLRRILTAAHMDVFDDIAAAEGWITEGLAR